MTQPLPTPDTTLSATELARILAQTAPHRSDGTVWKEGAATLLDIVEQRLHAVTTDRTAVAVGTADLHHTSGSWRVALLDADADTLQRWAASRGYDEDVHLATDGQRLDAYTATSGLHLPARPDYPLLYWREFLTPYLSAATGQPTALDTDALRRWSTSGDALWMDFTEPTRPVVVRGERFVGVQMPMKRTAPGIRVPGTDPTGTADTAPTLPLRDKNDDFAVLRAEMLKRVVTAEEAVTDAHQAQDGWAATAHIRSAGSAWLASRLLAELERIDPRQAYLIAAQVHEELDLGEFTDAAFATAVESGLDPSTWRGKYQDAKDAWLQRS
ncbi:hypothetical protein OG871_39810 (plasmid) [Kitasatospora sp. NBC_00374]|uniref:hypothetical protein n=1 Tax=Kitasatospora sp. NBC_00374 TaxID=2975964 RepID=UPI002F90E149